MDSALWSTILSKLQETVSSMFLELSAMDVLFVVISILGSNPADNSGVELLEDRCETKGEDRTMWEEEKSSIANPDLSEGGEEDDEE